VPQVRAALAHRRGGAAPHVARRDQYVEFDAGLSSSDPLGFVDSKPYSVRLAAMQQATSLKTR